MGLLRSIKLTWIICIFIGTGFITGIASADLFLYGTTSDGDAVGSTSTLVQIDHQDGDLLDTIGTGVGYLVNGMAWDRRSQRLYASTSTNDPAFTGLIVIDRASGVGTAVGTPDWGQGSGFSVSNITIDSNGNMVGWADNANQLVEIDKETGEITTFINIDNVTAINFGLSFDNINLLYLVNGDASGDNSRLWVFVDNTQDFTEGPSVEHESRQGDFYPYSNLYYGIDHTGTDTRSLVSIFVAREEDNFNESFETVDQLHTLAFAVTSSKGNGGSSSTCFIRSITGTD
jgi:hypothetical protein